MNRNLPKTGLEVHELGESSQVSLSPLPAIQRRSLRITTDASHARGGGEETNN